MSDVPRKPYMKPAVTEHDVIDTLARLPHLTAANERLWPVVEAARACREHHDSTLDPALPLRDAALLYSQEGRRAWAKLGDALDLLDAWVWAEAES